MSGTAAGGFKAAQKNKELYGSDYYVKLGANGGAKSRGGGFTGDPARAGNAGLKGGTRSGEVRRAKRDEKVKPLLERGWRFQDREILPPELLDPKKAAYFDKRRTIEYRDSAWDKRHGLKAYKRK